MEPVFSIIVPTRNRAAHLRRFLPSLAEQETNALYEIIVVDNGSTDETPAVLNEMSQKYPHFRSTVERRSGSAAARHSGAGTARSPIICFVDDDMLAGNDFVEQHLKAHSAHPGACILGRVVSAKSLHPFERMLAYIFDGGRQTLIAGKPVAVDYWSGNVSMPRELYVALGGYDQVFADLGYGLDIDFGKRLLARGIPMIYCPEAATLHHFDERFPDRLRKAYRSGQAYGYVRDNYPDLPIPEVRSRFRPIPPILIEKFCRIAAAILEPFDRGTGTPMKLLAFVYDLGLQTATARGMTRYERTKRLPAAAHNGPTPASLPSSNSDG